MTATSTKPHAEAPQVSEAPLLDDVTDLLRALAYYGEYPIDRVRLTGIAKRFLATNQALLPDRTPLDGKVRAWQIDKEWEKSLWK